MPWVARVTDRPARNACGVCRSAMEKLVQASNATQINKTNSVIFMSPSQVASRSLSDPFFLRQDGRWLPRRRFDGHVDDLGIGDFDRLAGALHVDGYVHRDRGPPE